MSPGELVRLVPHKSCETLYANSSCWEGNSILHLAGFLASDLAVILEVQSQANRRDTCHILTNQGKTGWIRSIYLRGLDENW